ncbi:MAG TPA: hypothetical protein VM406_01400 [Noviherbaspirillum sp.]|nr:hypothetical protein [Noviherbaspirillum sp.]
MASIQQQDGQDRQKKGAASGYAAGSEGWDSSEDFSDLPASSQAAPPPQSDQETQSEFALSRASDDDEQDGRFSVAEEQNFDQQSDGARRVGQVPADAGAAGLAGADAGDAMSESLQQDTQLEGEGQVPDSLKQAIERSVPPDG